MVFRILTLIIISCFNLNIYSSSQNIFAIQNILEINDITLAISDFLNLKDKSNFFISKMRNFDLTENQIQEILSFYYDKNISEILNLYKNNNLDNLVKKILNKNFSIFKPEIKNKYLIKKNLTKLLKYNKYNLENLAKKNLKESSFFFRTIKKDNIINYFNNFINHYKDLSHQELELTIKNDIKKTYQNLYETLKVLIQLKDLDKIDISKLQDKKIDRLKTPIGIRTLLLLSFVYSINLGFLLTFIIQIPLILKFKDSLTLSFSNLTLAILLTISFVGIEFILALGVILSTIISVTLSGYFFYFINCEQKHFNKLRFKYKLKTTSKTKSLKKLVLTKDQSKNIIDKIYIIIIEELKELYKIYSNSKKNKIITLNKQIKYLKEILSSEDNISKVAFMDLDDNLLETLKI